MKQSALVLSLLLATSSAVLMRKEVMDIKTSNNFPTEKMPETFNQTVPVSVGSEDSSDVENVKGPQEEIVRPITPAIERREETPLVGSRPTTTEKPMKPRGTCPGGMPPMFFPSIEQFKQMITHQRLRDDTMLKLVTFITSKFQADLTSMDQITGIATKIMPQVEDYIMKNLVRSE